MENKAISDKSYVRMEYKLYLADGQVVEQTPPNAPFGFIYNTGRIVSGLERAIEGMHAGQAASIEVPPQEAYGEHKAELIRKIPKKNFPEEAKLEIDGMYQIRGKAGVVQFIVRGVDDEFVQADFNHPLAGQRLMFDVKITEVREATDEDIVAAFNEGCGRQGCQSCETVCN